MSSTVRTLSGLKDKVDFQENISGAKSKTPTTLANRKRLPKGVIESSLTSLRVTSDTGNDLTENHLQTKLDPKNKNIVRWKQYVMGEFEGIWTADVLEAEQREIGSEGESNSEYNTPAADANGLRNLRTCTVTRTDKQHHDKVASVAKKRQLELTKVAVLARKCLLVVSLRYGRTLTIRMQLSVVRVLMF